MIMRKVISQQNKNNFEKRTIDHVNTLRMKGFRIIGLTYIILSILTGCKKDEESRVDKINRDVYAIMNAWYLWYQYVPDVDPTTYNTSNELLYDLVYKPIDRWSFIITYQEYMSYFERGEYIGHGFSRKVDEDNNVRIAFIYKDSDLYSRGVRRSWKIVSVNGINVNGDNESSVSYGEDEVGVENTFVFEDPNGQTHELVSAKKAISINSVLYSGVIDLGDKKVGHLVYEGFISPSMEELEAAFSEFYNKGITDLVLDLRYNGGGSMSVTTYLGSLIGGNAANNEILFKYSYNDKRAEDFDTIIRIEKESLSVDIENLVVITTEGTASASEVIINGLSPFIDVIVIGDDTHGKPVGMNVFAREGLDYAFAPVSFKITNAEGLGDYYDGIPADAYVNDDLAHDFSDPEELCLKQALYYIQNGTFDATEKKSVVPHDITKESITDIKSCILNTYKQ